MKYPHPRPKKQSTSSARRSSSAVSMRNLPRRRNWFPPSNTTSTRKNWRRPRARLRSSTFPTLSTPFTSAPTRKLLSRPSKWSRTSTGDSLPSPESNRELSPRTSPNTWRPSHSTSQTLRCLSSMVRKLSPTRQESALPSWRRQKEPLWRRASAKTFSSCSQDSGPRSSTLHLTKIIHKCRQTDRGRKGKVDPEVPDRPSDGQGGLFQGVVWWYG